MKKTITLFLLLTGCGSTADKVNYETQQPTAPSILVTINNTATGGSNTNTNTSGNATATGGTGGGASAGNSTSNANNSSTANTTNSGSASNQANNSTNNSSNNYQNNNQNNTQDVNTTQDVDMTNDIEVEAALLSGQLYQPTYSNNGSPKCKKGDKKVFDRYGQCFCQKKPKQSLKPGLSCYLYDLSVTKPNKLPDFSSMTPVYNFIIDQFDVVDQNYASGFPKIPDATVRNNYLEWYGIQCIGKLRVDKTDAVTFYLTSDDGSIMYLNNVKFIDNDGLHSTTAKQNTAFLSAGEHDIRIDYFQGPKVRISLILEWSYTGQNRIVVPQSVLKH
jgi:hypothetical protein